MWYRLTKAGRGEEAAYHGLEVPLVTPQDSPAPPGQSTLPLVIRLLDGRVMRRRKNPVAVEWNANSDLADIVMLKVRNYLKILIFYIISRHGGRSRSWQSSKTLC